MLSTVRRSNIPSSLRGTLQGRHRQTACCGLLVSSICGLVVFNVATEPDITEKYWLYSTVGLRSGKVAKDLRRGGINAYNLAGSILAWVGAATGIHCRFFSKYSRRSAHLCRAAQPPRTAFTSLQTQEGYPLVDGVTGEPTKQVHVFADKWALQGDGYEAVTFATGRYSPRTLLRQLVIEHCLLYAIYQHHMNRG